jgi:hypothetical protein
MSGPPLVIARQGSLEAGGRLVWCDTNDGADRHSPRWTPGRVAVDHVHASFQYPFDQRYAHPVLLCPGGGHSARVYDTTPDGREGWLSLFVRAGHAVYGVDWPNTARAGTDISKINAVRLGLAARSELPAINRYSAESAWVTFRWGPTPGVPYPDTQFLVEHAEAYYRQLVSTYREPTEVADLVAGFSALVEKVEPSVLLTWSGSGLPGYLAAARSGGRVKGIIGIETSVTAFANIPAADVERLREIPIVIVIGDRAPDRIEASCAFRDALNARGGRVTVDVLPEAGLHGNGHTLMLEKNNAEIFARLQAWLERAVYAAGA